MAENWPTVLKEERQRQFLKHFAECGRHDLAAQKTGINRFLHYDWLNRDEKYAEAYKHARQLATDMLEAEAIRRATEGVQRKKFTKGGEPIIDPDTEKQYVEREYSDQLMIHLLRGLRPEVYRERYEHTHKGEVHQKVILLGSAQIPKQDGQDEPRQLPET